MVFQPKRLEVIYCADPSPDKKPPTNDTTSLVRFLYSPGLIIIASFTFSISLIRSLIVPDEPLIFWTAHRADSRLSMKGSVLIRKLSADELACHH